MSEARRLFCSWPGCENSYSKPSKLTEHYRSHTQERIYACDLCDRSFLRKSHLQRHQQSSHLKLKPFVCSVEGCGTAFALRHHLCRHEKWHQTAKRPFACSGFEDCSEAFAKHEQLRRHVCRVHTGEPIFKCNECAEGFDSQVQLKQHQRRKHGQGLRSYMCGHLGCLQSFSKWSELVKHRRSHLTASAGGPFECPECGKTDFSSSLALQRHTKRHSDPLTGLREHLCPVHECGKLFSSRSNLKAHLLAVHATERPFPCPHCEKTYGYNKLLKRHVETCHGEQLVPSATAKPVSPLKLIDQITGIQYLEERPFPCPVACCQRRFLRQYDVDRHMQAKHSPNPLEMFIEKALK